MILKLKNRKSEASDVESFIFEPSEPITWKAGQFSHYVLHHEPTDDRGSDRWFTISSAPFENVVMLTTRFSNEQSSTFKKNLKDLIIGKSIEISDIDGDFVIEDSNKEYIFIAGGIGVTPFRAILKQLEHESKSINVTLLYANRDEHIPYKEELEAIAENNSNFKINYIISPERINENKIRKLVQNLHKPLFYISGPEPMVEDLGKVLKSMGIAEDHIKQDWFPGYTKY